MHVDEILLIRALNACRQLYLPTYLGLRVLSTQRPRSGDGLLVRSILRKLRSGDPWRYRQFQMYKGTRVEGGTDHHEYRACLAPSPITAFAEATLLSALALEKSFATSERVFSYRWPPHPTSGWSYQYFATGYRERNVAIDAALQEPNSVAVVVDIKSFYPSVNRESVLRTLHTLLTASSSLIKESRDDLMNFFSQLVGAGLEGIPIGPSSGHLLGHLALKEVDKFLTHKFGDRYFRYVDDIVVVTQKDRKSEVLSVITETLASAGFALNESKTVVLDRELWDMHVHAPDLNSEDTFSRFTSDLSTYLAFHADRASELSQQLSTAGFSLPVTRLLALSKYPRFRYFLNRRRTSGGSLHAAAVAIFGNVPSFVLRAIKLREAYESKLQELIEAKAEHEAETRRWRLQRARRVVNTLFYLWPAQEWQSKMSIFDAFPELVEQKALATALWQRNVSAVLPFYGRGAAAFSELWLENSLEPADFIWPDLGLAEPEIDSLMTLSISGAIGPITKTALIPKAWERLFDIGEIDQKKGRSAADLSFDDEIQSITLGIGRAELSQLIKSRYSLQESSVLDTLTLLGSEYRS